ncbi:hypothetical protein I4F81_005049 [Pyropia yezoensis]|uniref:Uncharacterized protein n=1 Tax=Pyropia yezoensis TaxID=2788 RepID=A0ACC3BXQ3_PYRYE|nr:hypothetical protein I4F81_005049 [Neopyropia yezoensis]
MDNLLGVETRLSALIHSRFDALVDSSGALNVMVGAKVKEELELHTERQPSADSLADSTAKKVCAAVRHTIATTPQFRSADQMSKDELVVAARRAAGGPKKLRELFPEILVKRILALVEGASDEEILDLEKKAKTFSNTELEKMVRGVVHQLYSLNKITPKEQRPPLMQAKTFLNVKNFDALDEAFLGNTRTSVHDGRSEARRVFYRMIAFFFIVLGSRIELVSSTAAAPLLGARAGSSYFAVEQTLRVSERRGGARRRRRLFRAPGDPPRVLAIVMMPYTFEAAVIDAVAKNMRRIVAAPDRSWCKTKGKDAEWLVGPGDWALLLPIPDGWALLDKAVQKMTASDQLVASAGPAGGAAGAEDVTVRVEDADSTAEPEDLPDYLR